MIYIASPFTDSDPQVELLRYKLTMHYTARLTSEGALCFSPIVYAYPMHREYSLSGAFLYWQRFNDFILSSCSAVHVLQLAGWQDSLGVAHEIAEARRLEMPITYIESAV